MSFMLNVIFSECHKLALFAECHYAECRYSECRNAEGRYAKCRGAALLTSYPEKAFK
jgi:hypothetical protein